MNKSFYNFEKIDVRWIFYFNFFNRNIQSKHVCQLAYNVRIYQQGSQLLLSAVSIQAMVSGWMGMAVESANGQV